jgi:diphthine synthase
MLLFVGLGLAQSPSLDAIELLKECDEIFYESYTSPVLNTDIVQKLSGYVNRNIVVAKREFVEDGRRMLDLAKKVNVALISSGDPMVATTHQELRARAINLGIETQIIHGSSILQAVAGELGLSSYSFGKVVTMVRGPVQHTPYNTVYQNLLRGLHTTILLEWDEANNFFLGPKEAISNLVEAERDLKYGIVTEQTLLFAVSGLGKRTRATLVCSSFSNVQKEEFGDPPTTLVIPGKLHFTEIEALSAIFRKSSDQFRDNSENVGRLSKQMVGKYSKKTLAALGRARVAAERAGKKYDSVFENVELYTTDSQRFLNEGREELAILSIGYAEGLLDSLRFSGELEFDW